MIIDSCQIHRASFHNFADFVHPPLINAPRSENSIARKSMAYCGDQSERINSNCRIIIRTSRTSSSKWTWRSLSSLSFSPISPSLFNKIFSSFRSAAIVNIVSIYSIEIWGYQFINYRVWIFFFTWHTNLSVNR